MRLRDSVRVPQRLDSDLFYTPSTQRLSRLNRNPKPPSYIDYDPDLRPAAFPTLENPPTHELSDQNQLVGDKNHVPRGAKRTRSGRIKGKCYPKTGNHENAGVDLEDLPDHLIDSLVASNGSSNPIYVKNMARMAVAGPDASSPDGAMEDSDPEEAIARNLEKLEGELATRIHNLSWKDLSERMQVEIFDNLLQNYSWYSTCHMLGLVAQERKTIEELLRYRTGQINLENSQLTTMRAKQLRELMRVDNSSRKRTGIPPQLVCRKISRQSICVLRDSTVPDYLLCEAKELANARRFLHKRGIDSKFAGEWSNVVMRAENSEPQTSEREGGVDDTLDVTTAIPASSYAHGSTFIGGLDRSHVLVSINDGGGSIESAIIKQDSAIDGENPDAPQQLLVRRYNESREHNLMVRLEIAAQRAVEDQDGDAKKSYIQPRKLWLEKPSLDTILLGTSSSSPDQLKKAQSLNSVSGPQLPITRRCLTPDFRKSMNKDRFYAPVPPSREPQTVFSMAKHQEGMENVSENTRKTSRHSGHQEEEEEEEEEEKVTDVFSEPDGMTIPINSSPPTTPGHILSPANIENDILAFSDQQTAKPFSERETPFVADSPLERWILRISSPRSDSDPEIISPSTRAVASQTQKSHTKEEVEGDEYIVYPEDDEMVLLPN